MTLLIGLVLNSLAIRLNFVDYAIIVKQNQIEYTKMTPDE